MKKILKENFKFILLMIILVSLFYIKLPYYIMAPGGTIDITDRVVMDDYQKKEEGSLNMLYVSEYDATPITYIVAKLRDWDTHSKEDRKISNESEKEVRERNKIMRDTSLDIATLVAYQEAGKRIEVKDKKNVVAATTEDNNLKVGDIILEVDGRKQDSVDEIRSLINTKEENDTITLKILRDNKEMEVESKVTIENNTKIIGVVIITEYDYETDPKIDIKFKDSESGSSGGLMLTLTIYSAISGEDLLKGRNIAGTGTISTDGTVGEIDGVKYKIMGAAQKNIDIVLVPSANYEEALKTKNKYNYDLEIVKVDTFKEAVDYLKNN